MMTTEDQLDELATITAARLLATSLQVEQVLIYDQDPYNFTVTRPPASVIGEIPRQQWQERRKAWLAAKTTLGEVT
jgi:hypothetical protein